MTLQTLQANVGLGEQLFVLKENGQYLPVTPTPGVPGGGAGPAPIAGVDDGGVAEAGSGGAAGTLVYLKGTAAVPGQVLTWNGSAWVALGVAPFRATFFVDPAFAGTSTGSEANPYNTIAAAFAAAAALAIASFIVYVPPNATITENVVFPNGGNVELAAQPTWGYFAAIINGTIDLSTNASARRALTGLQVTGVVSGNCSAGTGQTKLTNCALTQPMSLTATGAGTWRAFFSGNSGNGPSGAGGSSVAVTVAGLVIGQSWAFGGTLTFSGPSVLQQCSSFGGFASTAAGANTLRLTDTFFAVAAVVNFNAASGSLVVSLDGATASSLQAQGMTTTGATTITTVNAQRSVSQVVTVNTGANITAAPAPAGLYEAIGSLELAAAGVGAAVLNVTYTNLAGVLTTLAVTPALAMAGAVGSEVSGSVSFQHNGATAIAFTVTGIVTPGSINLAIAAAQRN
jgi:hypothetical protein